MEKNNFLKATAGLTEKAGYHLTNALTSHCYWCLHATLQVVTNPPTTRGWKLLEIKRKTIPTKTRALSTG